jgi:wyosine [tRNA(Phe)-imidazoG37] synthetase (radical SAM superfamily)
VLGKYIKVWQIIGAWVYYSGSMNQEEPVPYVFGPVPSRRLGISLGVDLTPLKTCTYDCLYCQVGKTTCVRAEPGPLVPIREVIRELDQKLKHLTPDVITISGSGEPTLHSEIAQLITHVRTSRNYRIAVITNGSLLWRGDVREKVLGADRIMPTLSTASEETFRAIHRPHASITLAMVIRGLRDLRQQYQGELFLETMLLRGINDGEKEIDALKRLLEEISPDRIQLNTVARPPSDRSALALDRQRLEDIRNLFGSKAEIIADARPKAGDHPYDSLAVLITEMARRRPVRIVDVADALGIPADEAESVLSGLQAEGTLFSREHEGDLYFSG